MSILGALPAPILAVLGFVLGSQAGMLFVALVAVTVHGGWAAWVIGLVALTIGAVVLISRGMQTAGRRSSFQLGLGVGGAAAALLNWSIVPYEIWHHLSG